MENLRFTIKPRAPWWRTLVLKSRLYVPLRPFANLMIWLAYTIKFFDWCAKHKAAGVLVNDRYDLYAHTANAHRLWEQPIDYLEFGVATGDSLNWWTVHNTHPDSRFYGFDTFTGIPEDWGWFAKGSYTAEGQLPDIDDPRVQYEIGLFQDTLDDFLRRFSASRQTIIHLDADLYSSTLFVLCSFAPFLKRGDIVIFDEIGSVYGFTQEFRALCNFDSAFGRRYRFIGGARQYMQVALEMT